MPRQLNLYIPKGGEGLIARAKRYAEEHGIPFYSLVLTALAEFLERREGPPRFRTFRLGVKAEAPGRAELYEDRLGRKLKLGPSEES